VRDDPSAIWRGFARLVLKLPLRAGGNLSTTERVASATQGKKMSPGGNFFLHGGAASPISHLDPARKKAGRSDEWVTPVRRFLL